MTITVEYIKQEMMEYADQPVTIDPELDSLGMLAKGAYNAVTPIIAQQAAEIEKLRGLLGEAKDDITAEVAARYPEEILKSYPSMQRRYNRDMDLPRRIEQALSSGQLTKEGE